MFRFPKNREVLNQWLQNMCRKDFVPSVHSRVCAEHFSSDDLELIRRDHDPVRRQQLGEELRRPRLKPFAVPRFRMGVPDYLLKQEGNNRCEQMAEASNDGEGAIPENGGLEDENDKVESLEEIEDRLLNEARLPEGFCVLKKENRLLLFMVDLGTDVPALSASVSIRDNLEFTVAHCRKPVDAKKFSEIAPGTIATFTQVKRLMAAVKCELAIEDSLSWFDLAVDCLDRSQTTEHFGDDSTKVAFLLEQLRMIGKIKPRFSPTLLRLASTINNNSPQVNVLLLGFTTS